MAHPTPEHHLDATHEPAPPRDAGVGSLEESHAGPKPDDGHQSHGDDAPHEPRHHDDGPRDLGGAHHHGGTVRTDELHHPHADLLDESELDAARDSPTRAIDALAEGLPSSDPSVRAILPEDFDKYGGMSRNEWNEHYWPSGETDAHGNPRLMWPDPDRHPEGFLSPEDRNPALLDPDRPSTDLDQALGGSSHPRGHRFRNAAFPIPALTTVSIDTKSSSPFPCGRVESRRRWASRAAASSTTFRIPSLI